MLTASTRVESEKAGHYLAQLCKHFAHKVPVQWDEAQGDVEFPTGKCRLRVADDTLEIACDASDETSLSDVQAIVENHLVRFAWREKLSPLDWQVRAAG